MQRRVSGEKRKVGGMAFKKILIFAGQPIQIKGKQPHRIATESKDKTKKFLGNPVPTSKRKTYCYGLSLEQRS